MEYTILRYKIILSKAYNKYTKIHNSFRTFYKILIYALLDQN